MRRIPTPPGRGYRVQLVWTTDFHRDLRTPVQDQASEDHFPADRDIGFPCPPLQGEAWLPGAADCTTGFNRDPADGDVGLEPESVTMEGIPVTTPRGVVAGSPPRSRIVFWLKLLTLET